MQNNTESTIYLQRQILKPISGQSNKLNLHFVIMQKYCMYDSAPFLLSFTNMTATALYQAIDNLRNKDLACVAFRFKVYTVSLL